jgi:hypothetical protein
MSEGGRSCCESGVFLTTMYHVMLKIVLGFTVHKYFAHHVALVARGIFKFHLSLSTSLNFMYMWMVCAKFYVKLLLLKLCPIGRYFGRFFENFMGIVFQKFSTLHGTS